MGVEVGADEGSGRGVRMSQASTDFVIGDLPVTGPVQIDIDRLVRNFGDCVLVQHGGSFRLHGMGFAMTLSPSDALSVIDRGGLGAERDALMRRVVKWTRN